MAQPAAKFRVGFVTATVWLNDNFYSVNLSKSYKDDEGNWQDTPSLSHGDVVCGIRALQRAENFIAEQ